MLGATSGTADVWRTKLFVPRPRHGLLPRARVAARLDAVWAARVAVVAAPAGFGKSSAVAAWLATTGRPHAWLSLDARDNDVDRFLAFLVEALRAIDPAFAPVLAGPERSAADDLEPWAAALVAAMATLPPSVLVLDDVHAVDDPLVHAVLAFVVGHAPEALRLVCVGRREPAIPLARRRAAGEVVDVAVDDLRADPDEVRDFVRGRLGFALDDETVDLLVARTEGWWAGVQLAALGVRGRSDAAPVLATFEPDPRHLAAYLDEEVLGHLTSEDRAFLEATAMLERLTGELCDAVTGRRDGSATLERLDRGHVFLVPLDARRRWYRYHHLFRELLSARRRAVPADDVERHRRAHAWFERQGFAEEAVDHAIAAGDWTLAAAAVERHAQGTVLRGGGDRVLAWTDALPDDAVRRAPLVRVFRAWTRMMAGDYASAEATLREVEAAFPADAVPDAVAGRAAAIRTAIASIVGDRAEAEALGAVALARLPEDAAPFRALTLSQLGTAALEDGDLLEARARLEEGVRVSEATGNAYDAWVGRWRLARCDLVEGRPDAAIVALGAVAEGLAAAGLDHLPARGYVDVDLARAELARGDLDAAEAHVARGLARLERHGGPTIVFDGWLTRAEAARRRGDPASARHALAAAGDLVARARLPARFVARLDDARARAEASAVASGALAVAASAVQARPSVPPEALSERERSLLPLLVGGMSNKEIARHLGVSVNTVKTHVRHVYEKLGVRTRARLIARVAELGLLDERHDP